MKCPYAGQLKRTERTRDRKEKERDEPLERQLEEAATPAPLPRVPIPLEEAIAIRALQELWTRSRGKTIARANVDAIVKKTQTTRIARFTGRPGVGFHVNTSQWFIRNAPLRKVVGRGAPHPGN